MQSLTNIVLSNLEESAVFLAVEVVVASLLSRKPSTRMDVVPPIDDPLFDTDLDDMGVMHYIATSEAKEAWEGWLFVNNCYPRHFAWRYWRVCEGVQTNYVSFLIATEGVDIGLKLVDKGEDLIYFDYDEIAVDRYNFFNKVVNWCCSLSKCKLHLRDCFTTKKNGIVIASGSS